MSGERLTLTLTLEDLVSSGCLSKCTFLYGDNSSNHYGNETDSKKLRCMNATKVSLLLVRTLVRFRDGCDNNEEGVIALDPANMKLDNFSVKLACPSPNSSVDNVVVRDAKDGDCEKDGEGIDNCDGLPMDYRVDALFDAHQDTTSLDLLFGLFGVGDESNQIEKPVEASQEKSSAASSGRANHTINEKGDERWPSNEKELFDKINGMSGWRTQWTLLEMEIDASKSPPRSKVNGMLLQSLGEMLFEIFQPEDAQRLSEIFQRSIVLEELENNKECIDESLSGQRRSSKLQRFDEQSLFSNLVDSGYYLVSVCRMLSDLIDTDEGGMADCPFTSLEEVLEDLEQMSTHPLLYLHDPEDGFVSSTLSFGHGCYGRAEQFTSMLKVASSVGGNEKKETVECLFVKGIAGSGKSFLMHSISNYLRLQGWLVLGGKFEAGLEYESRDVVCSVFDKLIADLVNTMDGKDDHDKEYSHLVSREIFDALDEDSLSLLASIIPSIRDLARKCNWKIQDYDGAVDSGEGNSHWRLVFLLSSLLGAVLSGDRHILFYFDDIQWSSASTLSLISEIVISMSGLPHARNQCLFVGLVRDDEVSDSHPFITQYCVLQQNDNVNVTDVHLPSFTKDEVAEMISSELRLPKRLIADFSEAIHRKAGQGHVIFLVQLFNTLVRDGIIAYSPTKKRYCFELERLNQMETWDTVASFIVSNLSNLSPEAHRSVVILSCLGMNIQKSIIHDLESCFAIEGASNIGASLPLLIDAGILESFDLAVAFSHDIIRKEIYCSIPIEQRQDIHLCLGEFLGSKTTFNYQGRSTHEVEGDAIEKLKISVESPQSQSLVTIATEQVNNASDSVTDEMQRAKYASWNLCAATETSRSSNFQAAVHFYKGGINFLGSNAWSQGTRELSYSLYKGAAFALLAVGDLEEVAEYANAIIKNVPFDQSLEAHYYLIKSLECLSKDQEAVALAVSCARQLGFDIPSAPMIWLSFIIGGVRRSLPSIVGERMRITDKIASQHNFDDLINKGQEIDQTKRNVLNLLSSILLAGLRIPSPYLPLIVCETVKYSFNNGCVCCGESAFAFCFFGYMKLWFEDDYAAGRRWGEMALKMLEKTNQKTRKSFVRTHLLLHSLLLSWDRPVREGSQELFKIYELGMKSGDVSSAIAALKAYFRWLIYSGEKLTTISLKYGRYLKQMIKYNRDAAESSVVDNFGIDSLMGKTCEAFSVFDGMIPDENALLADALSRKNSALVIFIYQRRFSTAFWMGEYAEAWKWSKMALKKQENRGPMLADLHTIGPMAVTAFHMYRDGKGEAYFDEATELLGKLEKWQERSEPIVKNKILLVRAEMYASSCEVKKALEAFEQSIQTARNYGLIHEQALAHELMGHYLKSIVQYPKAIQSYKQAYALYNQWGASAVATRLREKHILADDLLVHDNVEVVSIKRGRDC